MASISLNYKGLLPEGCTAFDYNFLCANCHSSYSIDLTDPLLPRCSKLIANCKKYVKLPGFLNRCLNCDYGFFLVDGFDPKYPNRGAYKCQNLDSDPIHADLFSTVNIYGSNLPTNCLAFKSG